MNQSGEDFLGLAFAYFEKKRNLIGLHSPLLLNMRIDLTFLFAQINGIAN